MTDLVSQSPSTVNLLRDYSIEVNPSQSKVVDAAVERLPSETEVFLSWIPGTNPMETIAPAAKLWDAGLIPVPHIGARHVESSSELERLAARLVSEANADRVLIVGGDRAKPAGPFDSSLAVMQSGALQKAGIQRIAIGGFPEGNPHIPDAILEESLTAKVKFAKENGIELSVVTQFCFEPEPIVRWLKHIRAQGIDNPVRIGVAGPASLITLARYAVRCGIGNSLHVLTENPSFARLLIENGPEPIIRGIADSAGPENKALFPFGIAGFHFYVFGGFNKTVDWIAAKSQKI